MAEPYTYQVNHRPRAGVPLPPEATAATPFPAGQGRAQARPGAGQGAGGKGGEKGESAEQFVGSVFKFSIATFANLGIYALTFLLTNFFVREETLGQVQLFVGWTNTVMTVFILGLDQALLRFYYKPPGGASANSLFRHCFYVSWTFLLIGLATGGTLLAPAIYGLIGFEEIGLWVIPLLFLNAGFFMTSRYFNVLYRLEGKVFVYTIQSVAQQFFYKLFFLAGSFFPNPVTAMVLFSVLGLGGFAVALVFIRRHTLRPTRPQPAIFRTILPYGLGTAPTAVFVAVNGIVPLSIITNLLNTGAAGIYSFAFTLSSLVTMVQGGFAAYWGPYMYKNYATQKSRILKVHDFINFIILTFFALLVIFEDVMFLVFSNYRASMVLLPLTMMSAVFNILCETTVHGNAIAKKPIFDTIGIGLGVGVNVLLCTLLIPPMGLPGAALAVTAGNGVAYFFRTLTGQIFYRSIRKPAKTAVALQLGMLLALVGTFFSGNFWVKALAGAVVIGAYCLMYRGELVRCVKIGVSILKSIFLRRRR